jgi:hypothetical protein
VLDEAVLAHLAEIICAEPFQAISSLPGRGFGAGYAAARGQGLPVTIRTPSGLNAATVTAKRCAVS